MPIYLYKCTDCGHMMEALQKMSDAKLVDCPACEAPALQKQVTAASFKLKGTGWYETDFKNSGAAPTSKGSSESSSSDSVSGESTTASKPNAQPSEASTASTNTSDASNSSAPSSSSNAAS